MCLKDRNYPNRQNSTTENTYRYTRLFKANKYSYNHHKTCHTKNQNNTPQNNPKQQKLAKKKNY